MALTLRLTDDELKKLKEIKNRLLINTNSGAIRELISTDKANDEYTKRLNLRAENYREKYLKLRESLRELKEAEEKLASLIEE